ncbi:uncharacterized protein [Blastocystis hominis]|uniref:Uncharacterized protein n=1 Tax=Blastocystis hominis TaxID=12968 RepID=D8LVI1_BLAHO|nr:uncharacterized protein [Blastocystis hominis]CBK19820.2 unnamed protein product [Blastocystis hominis]|eukprot:XP_012893868.1 uncharacterized protein [Blastocystis hominis]
MYSSDEEQSSVVESNEYSDSADEEVSIPEEEWVREEEELDQSIAAAGDIVNNSVALNEQYDEAILSIREMMQEEKYSEARGMCLNLLSGDLKYRCVNAEFWKLYANAEKERIVALPDI